MEEENPLITDQHYNSDEYYFHAFNLNYEMYLKLSLYAGLIKQHLLTEELLLIFDRGITGEYYE